jgi:hypothetical protein
MDRFVLQCLGFVLLSSDYFIVWMVTEINIDYENRGVMMVGRGME